MLPAGAFRESFPSVGALLAAAWGPPSCDYARETRESSMRRAGSGETEWFGCASREEADALAAAGVNRTVAHVACAAPRTVSGAALRPRTRYAVAGGSPVVPRVLAGFPDCMRRVARTARPGPQVSIRVNLTVSSHCSADDLTARGLGILGAVDALVRSGRRVSVTGYFATLSADGRLGAGADFVLKSADAPLDWQRLAFWLSHAAALRWHLFAWQDARVPEEIRRAVGWSRGTPVADPGPDPTAYHVGPAWYPSQCHAVTAASILAAVAPGEGVS